MNQPGADRAATTVMIADDQNLVRSGLRMILEAEEDLRVVAEAVDGVDAVRMARSHRPDVVLMDLRMPRVDGIEATRAILAGPESISRVAVLTTFSQPDVVYDALAAGASGFMLKDMTGAQLVGGVRAVARGEELLAPSLTHRLIEEFVARGRRKVPSELHRLTAREREVLQLLAAGLSNAEIAGHLVLSVETVKTHVARVLGKLGLRDRVQAVIFAYETGIAGTAGP